jgi:hypothetical protein
MTIFSARTATELKSQISRLPHAANSHLTLAYSRQTAMDIYECCRICTDQVAELRNILKNALKAHAEFVAGNAVETDNGDYERVILLAVNGLDLAQSLLNGYQPDKGDDVSLACAVQVLTSLSTLLNVLADYKKQALSNEVTI